MSMPRRRNASCEIVLYPGTTSSSKVDGRLAAVAFVALNSYCKFCRREKSMTMESRRTGCVSSRQVWYYVVRLLFDRHLCGDLLQPSWSKLR
jgi:hypothetical protein